MSKKVIVFGGSGFLGSHVADALSDAGYDVTIVDIKQSPYLRHDQKMLIGDILDHEFVLNVIKQHDIVYHFAGIADISDCAKNPVETVKYNILGTTNILDACVKSKIERFMFASSAYVYSSYGYFYRSSKQACESLIEDYYHLYGLKYTSLRYGSLYGERADERNSIYKLLKQAISAGKIQYHGKGDEIREFIHVQDAAKSSVIALNKSYECQCIMLTGTQVMKYSELLEMIQEMMNMDIFIEYLPSTNKAHYKITPYNFSPKLGKKFVVNPYIDMGQGLLQCMAEIYEKVHQL